MPKIFLGKVTTSKLLLGLIYNSYSRDYVNTSTIDVYWRIPSADWWVHSELYHRNPDTLKGPGAMLNQSRYSPQLRGSAHLCQLKTARTKESFDHQEKYFSPYRRTITSNLDHGLDHGFMIWILHKLRVVLTSCLITLGV